MKRNIVGGEQVKLTVKETRTVAPGVRQITLTGDGASDGDVLPGFDAGAHIKLDVPGVGLREYSLINLDPLEDTGAGVSSYTVGVRLEDDSTGGSIFMHALKVGDSVTCTSPRNDFALGPQDNPLLIAGGIGITPIASMVAALVARGAAFDLHYSGRSQGSLAFLDQLRAIAGANMHTHYDHSDTALDLTGLLASTEPSRVIYVCGPKGMIEAAKTAASSAGFAPENIRFELFARATPQSGDDAFEVEIASTGAVHVIGADQSIIQALEAAGLDLMHDCQRGDCGICQTDVVSGIPDHRDVVLSDEEKAAGQVMQICVSRAKSKRLVLDL